MQELGPNGSRTAQKEHFSCRKLFSERLICDSKVICSAYLGFDSGGDESSGHSSTRGT